MKTGIQLWKTGDNTNIDQNDIIIENSPNIVFHCRILGEQADKEKLDIIANNLVIRVIE